MSANEEWYKKYSKKCAKDFNFLTHLFQLYALYVVFFPFFGRPFYNIKLIGDRNSLKNKPCILAANHISYFDAFLVFWSTLRPVAFMAKKELFRNSSFIEWYVAANIACLGAFPVNREKLEVSTIKTAKEAIKARFHLCIFPQGGIRKNKKIELVNKGFVVIAKMMKVDIVPIGISGVESYNWSFFNKKNINVQIGEPISYELDDDTIIDNWRKQIAKMTGYELA